MKPAIRAAAVLFTSAMTLPAVAQSTRPAEVESVNTADAGPVSVRQLTTGLVHPWGMAFLPDGSLLVTERAGRLRVLSEDRELSDPVAGVPEVWANGQGGLLDVALDPDFADNRIVYLSYSKPGEGGTATTALGRGKLNDAADRIDGFEDIFVMEPYVEGPNHFGSRIVFDDAGHLFLTLGERFKFDPAQDLSSHLGSVIRIKPDGSVPDDNPFVDQPDAQPEIWSYGHRNVQAAAINPADGQLWVVEMGPLGGDELNAVEKGANYGWPVVSYGINYDGSTIPTPEGAATTRPAILDEFTRPAHHWSPVISPNGAVFYTGEEFPEWQGRLLVGGLSAHDVVVIELDGKEYVGETRVPLPDRIRDVEQGPDGLIYLLTDKPDGDVWRMEPLE